jgi:hypothetical protein
MPQWLVHIHGRLNDQARGGLTAAGLAVTSGHGGGTIAPGDPLPDIDHHSVSVHADTEQQASQAVREAVEQHGTFTGFEARRAE